MERRRRGRLSGRCLPPPLEASSCPAPPVPARHPSCVALLLAAPWPSPACGGSLGASGSVREPSSSVRRRRSSRSPSPAPTARSPSTRSPRSIVSMSATATEMLFAIGAGDQVKAVDSTSNYPSGAPTTKLSAFTPNAEAIAGVQPRPRRAQRRPERHRRRARRAQGARRCCSAPRKTLDDSYSQLETLGEGDRPRRRGRRGRRRHAGPDQGRRRRPSRRRAKGMKRLPRARPDLLLRDEQHVHRQRLHAVRPEEHRRRRARRRRRLSAAVRRVRRRRRRRT